MAERASNERVTPIEWVARAIITAWTVTAVIAIILATAWVLVVYMPFVVYNSARSLIEAIISLF